MIKKGKMKKIMLFIALSLFSLTASAIDLTTLDKVDSVTHKVAELLPDSSKVTLSTVYNDVKASLAGLAGALKVGSEHVYGVLIKQQVVYAIVYVVIFIISLILVLGWFSKFKGQEKWMDSGYDFPTGIGAVRFIQLVLGVIALSISIAHMNTIITGFINPEYGAIKDIVDFIK